MSLISAFYRRAKKSVHAAVLASIPTLILVTNVESPAGEDITRNEWLTVIAAVLGIGTTVYATRNTPTVNAGTGGDSGQGTVDLVIKVLLAVLLAVFVFWVIQRMADVEAAVAPVVALGRS